MGHPMALFQCCASTMILYAILMQGTGKRKGAIAVYLEPWHADIYALLDFSKTHGKEENCSPDLYYALWVPDLFMERVQSHGECSLFCPNQSPGLADCWGDKFEELYHRYERQGKATMVVQTQHRNWNSLHAF